VADSDDDTKCGVFLSTLRTVNFKVVPSRYQPIPLVRQTKVRAI